MRINNIESEDFKDLLKDGLNGVFIFVAHDCSLCDQHLQFFEQKNMIPEINVINCLEDTPFFLEFGVDDMPTTRIYKNGTMTWEKTGKFFDKQIKELKENI